MQEGSLTEKSWSASCNTILRRLQPMLQRWKKCAPRFWQADGQPNPKPRDAARDMIAEIFVPPTEEGGVAIEVRERFRDLISNCSKILGFGGSGGGT